MEEYIRNIIATVKDFRANATKEQQLKFNLTCSAIILTMCILFLVTHIGLFLFVEGMVLVVQGTMFKNEKPIFNKLLIVIGVLCMLSAIF